MIRRLLARSSSVARRLLVWELVCIVATAILQGLAFLLLVPLLRELFGGDPDAARGWLLALIAVAVMYALAAWGASQLGMSASTAVLDSLLTALGERVVRLPLSWFSTDRSGRISQIATTGAMFVSSTPYSIVRLMLTGFLTPATVLVGMFAIDARLALAMAATTPVMWVVYRYLRRSMGRDDVEHAETTAAASSRVIEFARAQPTLRTAAPGSVADRLVDEALDSQHEAYRGLLLTGGGAIAAFGGVVQLATTILLVVGAYLAIGGQIDPATLIALLVLGVRFTEPITHSGALGGGVAVATTTLDQLDALDAVTVLSEPEAPATPVDHAVRFTDVTFGYGADPVLRDLSFEAPSGRMTAIVGPSGSGKTTITRLVARFYDPESGEVSIGGVPLPDLGSDAIEAAVAPVFQDVYLFDDTLLGNVWIGAPDLGRDAVIAAATRARVDEIAARLPGGWDARVGEGGANLSGGERQRVSIARALLKDAPIVLLDEATSALDIGNEIAIGDAVQQLRAERTIIVVAHRLQTIMTADRILMLDASGRIAESGTHAELLATDGAYARYWTERVAAAGWQIATS